LAAVWRISPLLHPRILTLNANVDPVLKDSARIVLSELWDHANVLDPGALAWEKGIKGSKKENLQRSRKENLMV
jgi:hypothetical protein